MHEEHVEARSPTLTKRLHFTERNLPASRQPRLQLRVTRYLGVPLRKDTLVLVDAIRLDVVALDLVNVAAASHAGRVRLRRRAL